MLLALAIRSGTTPAAPEAPARREPLHLPRMVFLQRPEPGGGGGGGGKRMAQPPSRAQARGNDRLTMPVAAPVVMSEQPRDTPTPAAQLVLDARPLAGGTDLLIGLPEAPASLPFSGGPGSGGGVGSGTGTGLGSGSGPGIGPGSGGGFGGGAYHLGRGVVAPTLLKKVRPNYTVDALRQGLQGTVALEVVVSRDGVPVAIRVTRSLDPHGLDEEAITAVREWRFVPGRIGDTPVDVLVNILLDFRIS
jgi:TonB family protein